MKIANSQLWFVVHSGKGPCDPVGFYCPECFEDHVEKDVFPMDISVIKPENAPKYRCDLCLRDYRDFK